MHFYDFEFKEKTNPDNLVHPVANFLGSSWALHETKTKLKKVWRGSALSVPLRLTKKPLTNSTFVV